MDLFRQIQEGRLPGLKIMNCAGNSQEVDPEVFVQGLHKIFDEFADEDQADDDALEIIEEEFEMPSPNKPTREPTPLAGEEAFFDTPKLLEILSLEDGMHHFLEWEAQLFDYVETCGLEWHPLDFPVEEFLNCQLLILLLQGDPHGNLLK